MANAIRVKAQNIPKRPDEKARLKIVSGPDHGSVFIVVSNHVTIGRGEGCDVILSDLKTSRLHADLTLTSATWNLKDLGSANGISHNGKDTKLCQINSGDTFSLGETTIEFYSVEVGTQVLLAAPKSINEIKMEQAVVNSQKEKIKAITSFGGIDKLVQQNLAGNPINSNPENKRKLVIVLGMILVVGLFIFPETKSKIKKTQNSSETTKRDLATYLPGGISPEASKTVEMFFKSGFREFREQNYLRAKTQFETVLQIDPNHNLAKIYLKNSEQAIDEEVKYHLESGKKDFVAGKLAKSIGHYESVLRLLHKDQSSSHYIEAKEQIEKIKISMKSEL